METRPKDGSGSGGAGPVGSGEPGRDRHRLAGAVGGSGRLGVGVPATGLADALAALAARVESGAATGAERAEAGRWLRHLADAAC